MLDIDTEEVLIRKVGGKFALTALLQKRMVELNRGAPPLVKVEGERSLRRIVCQEILEDKIKLAARDDGSYTIAEERARIESTSAPSGQPKEENAEIYGSDIKKIKEQRIKELAQILNPKK